MTYYKMVMINDLGMHTHTGWAEAAISGGDLLQSTSTNSDVVGSDISTYAYSDIHVKRAAEVVANGVALTDAAISGAVAFATDGIFILPAGSSGINAGSAIMSAGYENMVQTCGDESGAKIIGRALTKATALSGFAIVRLRT